MGFTKEDEKAFAEFGQKIVTEVCNSMRLPPDLVMPAERTHPRAQINKRERSEMKKRRARIDARHKTIARRAGEAILALMHKAMPMDERLRAGQKTGRNEPCPCGSGLKYKRCHGRPAGAS